MTESYAQAYHRLLPEILELDPRDHIHMNLDVGDLVSKVLGATPKIHRLRQAVEDTFKAFDLKRFDDLAAYAGALSHADALYRSAGESAAELPVLMERARPLRNILHN